MRPPAASEEMVAEPPAPPEIGAVGASPWRIAGRRLRRNRTALAFGALFLVLVATSLAAPLWAEHVAHRGPSQGNLSGKIEIGGERRDVVALDGVPIGPTWRGEYFLGADQNGRDIMVRLLYGGRNSLSIGVAAALLTMLLATALGLLAGYFRGWIDGLITKLLDVLWAFPPILLGIALGVALTLGGLNLGVVEIPSGSKAVPIFVIAVVGAPYIARPVRGLVLSLREKEFVEAARAQGAGHLRIMFSELLPNLASTLLVLFTLDVAVAIQTEAALSFLGAGVQPPDSSWGTMIGEGVNLLTTAEHLAIVPGVMLVLTTLALNIFGDGVRDALDPRAKIRIER